MGCKVTIAVYYKLSHLSEKITHQIKSKYILKKTNGASEFLECRGNRKCLWSKNQDCLYREEKELNIQ